MKIETFKKKLEDACGGVFVALTRKDDGEEAEDNEWLVVLVSKITNTYLGSFKVGLTRGMVVHLDLECSFEEQKVIVYLLDQVLDQIDDEYYEKNLKGGNK